MNKSQLYKYYLNLLVTDNYDSELRNKIIKDLGLPMYHKLLMKAQSQINKSRWLAQ